MSPAQFLGSSTLADIIKFSILLRLKNQRSGCKTVCGFSIIFLFWNIYQISPEAPVLGYRFRSTACSIIKKQTPAQILYNNHFKTTQDRYIFFRRSLSDCFGRMSMYWILPFVQIPKLNKMTGVYTSLANNKSKQLGHPEILKRPEHLSI